MDIPTLDRFLPRLKKTGLPHLEEGRIQELLANAGSGVAPIALT